MEYKNIKLIRFEPEPDILPFNCGDTDLNGFLFDNAKKFAKIQRAVTKIIQDQEKTSNYFNYFNDYFSQIDKDSNVAKFIERVGVFSPKKNVGHKCYLAVKIYRLAVNIECKTGNLGKMIVYYTREYFKTNNKTNCNFITVDAYKYSLEFYKKMEFNCLSSNDKQSDTQSRFFNLQTIT